LGALSLPTYRIVVNYVSEGEVANLVRGYVELNGRRINFSGVAYGRFGGQNFSPQFTAAARRSLRSIVGDVERFETDIQMRLVRGEFDAVLRKGEEHRHQHLRSETR
jgi:hypothetical protein